MCKIFITGDTHGDIDIKKLTSKYFPKENLTVDDYVLICGDAGIVWDGGKFDKYIQNWYNDKPWTTIFIDGNHENFDTLEKYPVENWHGGKVHKISNKIIHLMRGQIFDICGKKIFTFGGASSHDKEFRKEGVSWWSQELPTFDEFKKAKENLDSVNNKVDIIVTHDAPESILYSIYNGNINSNQLNSFLDQLYFTVNWKKWFCGHHHRDMNVKGIEFLYNTVLEITEKI